jgi:hypothetical protein
MTSSLAVSSCFAIFGFFVNFGGFSSRASSRGLRLFNSCSTGLAYILFVQALELISLQTRTVRQDGSPRSTDPQIVAALQSMHEGPASLDPGSFGFGGRYVAFGVLAAFQGGG